MQKHHYLLIVLAIIIVCFLTLRGCVHCTGRALSGQAPVQTVVVPDPVK